MSSKKALRCQPIISDGKIICAVCGVQLVPPAMLKALGSVDLSKLSYPCKDAPRPTIIQKAANVAKAVVKHVRTGRVKCSDAQIDARLAVCFACPGKHYRPSKDDAEHGECLLCGCPITRKRRYLDKLPMASERCPRDYWREVDRRFSSPEQSGEPQAGPPQAPADADQQPDGQAG